MTKKMLIDASHAEETRVVILDQDRVEDFDFEAASRRPIRGNIYLAKVTRVEPSLQAAFVDYGGNRHGFLPLGEIHPDYYQIPVSDRQDLLEEQAKQERAAAGDDVEDGGDDEDAVEQRIRVAREKLLGRYRIQEVIRRRQILLVQVAKEERGTKGAALTTYLSLAGRYCVLMPNTARGGGISRKIANATDRKRLKQTVSDLEVPKGMGVIIRTAGQKRTKTEIKRDYDHLLRLWENIRTLTLQSMAPSLIYEEGSLVKRAIRDLYDKSIESVMVEGDNAYREAKDFMKMLMPSHAKNVQRYKDDIPLFQRHRVESQLDTMLTPRVELRSGGYLIINPTEALVSIDVNSGRATQGRNVEQTALKTNLEAADEVARQCRLRDLAGLVVIDFIDMEDGRNNRAVEKRLKDALKLDRARTQVGRISGFGLMELSRQRRRSNVMEGTTLVCPHCAGTGYIRAPGSAALAVIRGIEDEAAKKRGAKIVARAPTEAALYALNKKRGQLGEIEARYGVVVSIEADPELASHEFAIEAQALEEGAPRPAAAAITQSAAFQDEPLAVEAEPAAPPEPEAEEKPTRSRRRRRRASEAEPEAAEDVRATDEVDGEADGSDEAGRAKRRRRGRRGGRGRRRGTTGEDMAAQSGENGSGDDATPSIESDDGQGHEDSAPAAEVTSSFDATEAGAPVADAETAPEDREADEPPKPARRRRTRRTAKEKEGDTAAEAAAANVEAGTSEQPDEAADAPKPTRRRRTRRTAKSDEAPVEAQAAPPVDADAPPPAEIPAAAPAEPDPTPTSAAAPEPETAKPANDESAPAPQSMSDGNGADAEAATESEALTVEDESDAPKRPARKGWWQRAFRGL